MTASAETNCIFGKGCYSKTEFIMLSSFTSSSFNTFHNTEKPVSMFDSYSVIMDECRKVHVYKAVM